MKLIKITTRTQDKIQNMYICENIYYTDEQNIMHENK